MQIAQSSTVALDPVIEALKLMSNPSELKKRVKTLEDATKKFNEAKKKYDKAAYVARTVEAADSYVESRKKAIDELEAKRNKVDEARKQKLSAWEMSLGRREGAFETLVKDHTRASNLKHAEQHTQAQNLARRETTLERGNAQLKQDNASLKTAQEALSERRARLAQALKN